jgi:choice-of-anchor A domain-containing protein
MYSSRSNRSHWRILLAVSLASLAPALSRAAEPHSWCVTGAPMVLNGGDTVTNSVLNHVCGKPELANCCTSTGRWTLTCVQTGAAAARLNGWGNGDPCGRYAWAQGPIPGTQQFYPRDFNLFAVNGAITGLRDTDGPVASSGTTNLSYFSLNIKRREPLALLSQGGNNLTSGSIYGAVQYSHHFTDGNVTYFDAPRPSAATSPFPIDFATTRAKLAAMSQALKAYDAIPATKAFGTVTFTGSDPELNVFSIPASMLTGTTAYSFMVPALSNIIVNVSGTSPAFANAGMGGNMTFGRVVWNFPDATTLQISSMAFNGAILAPNAAANFNNGSISGTVVVGSAQPANVELYASTYQVPSCTGGLCLDKTWSTSAEARIDDDGRAPILRAEAGFLQLSGGSYIAENTTRSSPRHRIWYSFHPALVYPSKRPLMVFFNGGPGSATSHLLFSFNTAPWTLDPQRTGSQRISANPNSWTQFANLLYIDSPAAGFSYPLKNSDGTKPSVGTDMDRDAGTFLRTIVAFLKRHPAIVNNPVVLVGESYGGTRAELMLRHLYEYPSLNNGSTVYQDLDLAAELNDYFKQVFAKETPSPAELLTKWGHQVLIQSVVAGAEQDGHPAEGTQHAFPAANCQSATCFMMPTTCDPYNCDQADGWSESLSETSGTNLTDVTTLGVALGVDPRSIRWMYATERTDAYGRNDGRIASPINMPAVFGENLGTEDNYMVMRNDIAVDGYPGASLWYSPGAGLRVGTAFVKHLKNNISTFLTVTKYDTVVRSPDIPYALGLLQNQGELDNLVDFFTYNPTATNSLARPGVMWAHFLDGAVKPATMTHTYASGHTVPMRAPAELLTDVKLWYSLWPH